MAAQTRFTELVGCTFPVQLAPMGGGVGGPDLAAAVRDAGGLGMVSWSEPVPSGCGINFLVPFISSPSEVAEAARHCGIVEFFYGEPSRELVDAAHSMGAVAGWQVGSGREAELASEAGCDYVVAQGTEAGGHVRGTDPLDKVLDEVLDQVAAPVLAAGGIATAQRVAELLRRGASGVRIGTRFLTCPESNAHEDYVANLIRASGEDTVLTDWFGEGWPDAPHRVLRSALEAAQQSAWKSPIPPSRHAEHTVAEMAQYAGTGVTHVTSVQSAAEVMTELVALC
jgi:NAD(P)H-dependent flavin oxidoreductase YrpB (nitropropane dioxygenase family)